MRSLLSCFLSCLFHRFHFVTSFFLSCYCFIVFFIFFVLLTFPSLYVFYAIFVLLCLLHWLYLVVVIRLTLLSSGACRCLVNMHFPANITCFHQTETLHGMKVNVWLFQQALGLRQIAQSSDLLPVCPALREPP